MLIIGFFIFYFILCFSTLETTAGESPIVVKYHFVKKDGVVQIYNNLSESQIVLPGTYQIKSRVGLKTKMENQLKVVHFLRSVKKTSFETGDDSSDSANTQSSYTGTSKNVSVSYKVDYSTNSIYSDSDHDKLVIDYKGEYPDNSIPLQLKLTYINKRLGSSVVAVSKNPTALVVSNFVDCVKSGYESRNKLYLVKRELGLPGSTVWQFIEDAGKTVLQRRFNLKILDRKTNFQISRMDLYLRSGVYIERINFTVKVPIWHFSRREIIEGPTSFQNLFVGNKKELIRVNLEKYFDRYKDVDLVILDELHVFIKGKPTQIMSSMPIHSIKFYQPEREFKPALNKDEVVNFHLLDTLKLDRINKRLTLDILKINEQIKKSTSLKNEDHAASDYRLEHVEVISRPDKINPHSGLKIERLFLAKEHRVPVPVIVSDIQSKAQKWKGAQAIDGMTDQSFKWMKIYDYQTFSESFQRPSVLIDSNSMDMENKSEGLLLKSRNSTLTFKLSSKIRIKENCRFNLMVDPLQNSVDSVLYTFTDHRGKKYSAKTLLNKPISFPAWLHDVVSVKTVFSFKANEITSDKVNDYKLFLKSAIFFEPTTINIDDLWETPFVSNGKRHLLPEFQEKAGSKGGLNDGFFRVPNNVLDGTIRLRTFIDRPAGTLYRLDVATNISRSAFENDPCWMELTIHGTRNTSSCRLCYPDDVGMISLNLSDYLWRNGFDSNEIINSISWKMVSNYSEGVKGDRLRLTLYESFSTLDEKIKNDPLLSINGIEYFPLNHDNYSSKDNGNSKLRLVDYGKLHIPIDQQSVETILKRHPYFKTEDIVFERIEPITSSQVKELFTFSSFDDKKKSYVNNDWSNKLKLVILAVCIASFCVVLCFVDLTFLKNALRSSFLLNGNTLFFGMIPGIWLQLFFWIVMSIILYVVGMLIRGAYVDNYFFTFGNVAFVFFWRANFLITRNWLHVHFPMLASNLYGSNGALYLYGTILLLAITALFIIVHLEAIAEKIAGIAYCMLFFGVFCELRGTRKNSG